MGFHTYDVDRADELDDPSRFAYCSVEELLGLLDAGPSTTVADLGSGTGFYTDEIAPAVGRVLALDVQRAMVARHLRNDPPGNVDLVVAVANSLPFRDRSLDGVISTFTYHEFAEPSALAELHRALRSGGRLVIVDWTANGTGQDGPPLDERFSLADAAGAVRAAGFDVARSDERRDTFAIAAVRPE